MPEPVKKEESKVEVVKRQSRHLRGTIGEALASDATHFSDGDVSLLKFHGIYEQDDRDVRHERRKAKQEEAYMFMVRCAIPGGILTAEQYLNLDDIAEVCGNGSLRVTTRQGFQFHGVLKHNLKTTIRRINEKLVTTLSACGDVERNVMACPAPLPDEAHATIRQVAREIAVQLRPGTRAYHEIWLNGEKLSTTQGDDEEEPFYEDVYLPRKFKTAIALMDDNCVDVYNNDQGFIAIHENGRLIGFNLVAGGGMGMTHGKADTIAHLAAEIGFIEPGHILTAARTTAAIFRDFGNRADRRHARLKYLLVARGVEWFREEFRKRVEFPLHPWRSVPPPVCHDHLGKQPQEDGTCFYGVFIENGRIRDHDGCRIRSALRTVVTRFRPGVTLTPHQNLLLTGMPEQQAEEVERILGDHGVKAAADLSAARRFSMACPALPTCGLAMAESERLMPSVVDRLERELESLGLRHAPITIRMTGCPNGCARPYTADISFVGRRPDVYHVYVGGGLPGNRVVDLYAADVKTEDIVKALGPLLAAWAKNRQPGESLSDFYQRLMGPREARQTITGNEDPTRDLVRLKLQP